MKKRLDPLWKIVGEEVRLDGSEEETRVSCPDCHVVVCLPAGVGEGHRFRCGLCGAVAEVTLGASVSDDGSAKVVARLAE